MVEAPAYADVGAGLLVLLALMLSLMLMLTRMPILVVLWELLAARPGICDGLVLAWFCWKRVKT